MPKKPKKKIIIPDTNVFLLNPHAISVFNKPGNKVVIPFAVLEELDGLKKSKTKGYEAREAIRVLTRMIEKSGAHRKGITPTFKEGGQLVLDDGVLLDEHFGPINRNNMDNRIIATSKKYSAESDSRVLLISNDSNMRLKASARNISSEEFEALNFGSNGVDDLYLSPQYIPKLSDDTIQDLFSSNAGCSYEYNSETSSYHEGLLFDRDIETDPQALLRSGDQLLFIKRKPYAYLTPRNAEQTIAMYLAGKKEIEVLVLVGQAGTGKTIIALEAALKRRLNNRNEKIYIFRPVDQAGEELGFLPGTLDEKMAPYKKAIGDAYRAIQESGKKKLEDFDKVCHQGGSLCIMPVNYVRGTTISNSTVIIDEAQNFTELQMKTLLTRIGENTNVIITGDPDQIDNRFITKSSCGLTHVIGNFRKENWFAHITLIQGERSKIAEMAAKLL